MACNPADIENKQKYSLIDKFYLLCGAGVIVHALFFTNPSSLIYLVEVLIAFTQIYLAIQGKSD